jgi:hypothetical protein
VGETNQAGKTYAGIFAPTIQGQERQMIVVALGSSDLQGDVAKLIAYAKAHDAVEP